MEEAGSAPPEGLLGVHIRSFLLDYYELKPEYTGVQPEMLESFGAMETVRWISEEATALYERSILGEVSRCVSKLRADGFGGRRVVVASDSSGLANDVGRWLRSDPEMAGTQVAVVGAGKRWSPVHSFFGFGGNNTGDYLKTWAEWFLLQEATAVVRTSRLNDKPVSYFLETAMRLRSPSVQWSRSAICDMSICFSLAWDILLWHFLHNVSLVQASEALASYEVFPRGAEGKRWGIVFAGIPRYSAPSGEPAIREVAERCQLLPGQITAGSTPGGRGASEL